MRMSGMTVAGVALLMALSGTLSGGQFSPQPTRTPGLGNGPPSLGGGRVGEPDPLPPRIEEQRTMARSTERQKKLIADTDKLLSLATDLKMQVDKTNKDILSVDVIKKADEIEKLAHSVKERMKG